MDEFNNIKDIIVKLRSSLPICRVCMEISMEYIEFESTMCVSNGQEITYSDGFNELTKNILKTNVETIPMISYFCSNCGKDLLTAYLFIKRVEHTNNLLSRFPTFSKNEMCFSNLEYEKKDLDIQEEELSVEQDGRLVEELVVDEGSVENEEFLLETEDNSHSIFSNEDDCRESDILAKTEEDLEDHEQFSYPINTLTSEEFEFKDLDSHCLFDDCANTKTKSKSNEKHSYRCTVCACEFKSKRDLNVHKIRSHVKYKTDIQETSQDPQECKECNEIVPLTEMEKHLTIHYITKYECDICGKSFEKKIDLKQHSYSHLKRQPGYDCHICGKTCLRPHTLKKHIYHTHLSERRKYQCEECGLFFPFPSNLKEHRRIHNITHQFHCPKCDRTFLRKPQLDIHMRYHLNYFPYKCDKCDKCYVTKSNLNDHIKSAHTKVTFDCDKCMQKFKSQTGLRKHKFTHDGYPYNCPICSIGQTARSAMKHHMMGVHKDAVTEDEFNVMFPIIVPRTGFRRPKDLKKE